MAAVVLTILGLVIAGSALVFSVFLIYDIALDVKRILEADLEDILKWRT